MGAARKAPPAQTPQYAGEVIACSGWLEREIASVQPRVIVALGATALRALAGVHRLGRNRARAWRFATRSGAQIVCTYHPPAILRAEVRPRANPARATDSRPTPRLAIEPTRQLSSPDSWSQPGS